MFLGIDIGTSSVKALIIDSHGQPKHSSDCALAISRPQPLWSEQDPESWWQAVKEAVTALPIAARARVRGVGLSGQMHGATLLDKQGAVLRPAILWNDGRSFNECQSFEAREPDARSLSGNIAMPGFTAPKLIWLKHNEPKLFERVDKVLLPKDYIRWRLSGDFHSDLSDASGTLWLNVAERRWSSRLLAATELAPQQMPSLCEGNEITGELSASAADQLGLPVVPIAAGAGDNAAGAVGAGVLRAGDTMLSMGTSGVLFVVDEVYQPNTDSAVHTFCHALPGLWHRMAVLLSAASCLAWVVKLCNFDSIGEALSVVGARQPARATPIFLPYLSGERTPHNNPHATGCFVGLNHESDSADLVAAVLEGVAFAYLQCWQVLSTEQTQTLDAIHVVGGGAQSSRWLSLIASALQVPLCIGQHAQVGPALGAAQLARMAVDKITASELAGVEAEADMVFPEPETYPGLHERYADFLQLYPKLF